MGACGGAEGFLHRAGLFLRPFSSILLCTARRVIRVTRVIWVIRGIRVRWVIRVIRHMVAWLLGLVDEQMLP